MKTFIVTTFCAFFIFVLCATGTNSAKFKCGVGFDEGLHTCMPYFKCENNGKESEIRDENGVCEKDIDVCCKIENGGNSKGKVPNKKSCSGTRTCMPYYQCTSTNPSYEGCNSYLDVCCELPTPSKPKCSCTRYYNCNDPKPSFEGCDHDQDVCCESPKDNQHTGATDPNKQKCITTAGDVHYCTPYYKCKDRKPEFSNCQSDKDVCCQTPDISN